MQPRILVVEDEPSVRMAIRAVLEPAGFSIEEAGSAEQARPVLRRDAADLALLVVDLGLPGATGLDLLRDLQREAADGASMPPVLIVSGDAGLHASVAGFKAGAKLYVTKPFGSEELLRAARALTRRRLSGRR